MYMLMFGKVSLFFSLSTSVFHHSNREQLNPKKKKRAAKRSPQVDEAKMLSTLGFVIRSLLSKKMKSVYSECSTLKLEIISDKGSVREHNKHNDDNKAKWTQVQYPCWQIYG